MGFTTRDVCVAVTVVALVGVSATPSGAQSASAIVEDFTEERLGTAPVSFSTPTGFWSIGTNGVDSKPVLFEDGTQWQGSQTANTLSSQARALYGDRWNEFIDDLPGTAYFPIALFNKVPSFTGGTITARLATVGGDIDQDAGIVFNYQPNGDMMAIRMDSLENNMKLYQWIQGQPSVLKLAENVPTAMARWHDLSISVSNGGAHVQGSLDGFQFIDADIATPVSGQVGAWAKTDTVVLFDSFVVEPSGE